MKNKYYILKVYNAVAILYQYNTNGVLQPFSPDQFEDAPVYAPDLSQYILDYLNDLEQIYTGYDFTKTFEFLERNEDTTLKFKAYADKVINQFKERFFEWNIELINELDKNDSVLWIRTKKFIERLLNCTNNLYPKYAKLLDLYESKKDKLINDVSVVETEGREDSAEGIAKVNDTPQESGNYSVDDYTSSVSKTESTGESSSRRERYEQRDTYINLLKDVEEKLSNIMLSFVNELGYRLTWYNGGEEYEER